MEWFDAGFEAVKKFKMCPIMPISVRLCLSKPEVGVKRYHLCPHGKEQFLDL